MLAASRLVVPRDGGRSVPSSSTSLCPAIFATVAISTPRSSKSPTKVRRKSWAENALSPLRSPFDKHLVNGWRAHAASVLYDAAFIDWYEQRSRMCSPHRQPIEQSIQRAIGRIDRAILVAFTAANDDFRNLFGDPHGRPNSPHEPAYPDDSVKPERGGCLPGAADQRPEQTHDEGCARQDRRHGWPTTR